MVSDVRRLRRERQAAHISDVIEEEPIEEVVADAGTTEAE